MKKVLLVNTNTEKLPYPVPPLGICIIASCLQPYYEVEVYDGVFDEGKNLQRKVLEFCPHYIGFSIRNIDDVVADRKIFYPARIISDFIQPVQAVTDVPVILGGSGFSIFPEELMDLTGADYGLSGEGEDLMLELLTRLDREESVEGLPNVYSKGKPLPAVNSGPSWVSIQAVPWSEVDLKISFNPYRQKGVYSLQTKRGCSMGCVYCTYPCIEGKRYRQRDPSDIAEEISQASKRLGDITFEFVDSTFNEPREHAEALCQAIIDKKLKVRLRTMGINPHNTDRKLFELMVRAGFAQIDVTPDSASEIMIKNLRKGFGIDDIHRTADLIREFNLPAMWFFLFGGPGETEQTFRESIDFIDQYVNPEDLVYLSAGLRIYPGTPLHKTAVEEGLLKPGEPIFYPSAFYFSDKLGKEGLDRLIQEASKTRINCLPSNQTTPSPEMIQEAVKLRQIHHLTEPMFRTLLRIRKKWIASGKLSQEG